MGAITFSMVGHFFIGNIMKTVLLLTDVSFWEGSSGHRARIKALIEYLSQKIRLTVINTGPAPSNIEQTLHLSYNAEFFVLEKRKYLSSTGYGRKLKKLLIGRIFDSVIIEYIHSSYFLNFLEGNPQIILDAHDIISERTNEFIKFNYAGVLYELAAETEVEIMNIYDKVIVLCEPDYIKLRLLFDEKKILLCPHPVRTHCRKLRSHVRNISYVASAYLPNKDAIEFFIKNTWPLISEKYPGVKLSVYGTVCTGLNTINQNNILLKGFVSALDRIYDGSDIIINPIRFGAGMKIKNIEALANGVPLVTTSHGARGLENGCGKAFLVADEPKAFAEAVILLIENYQTREYLARNAIDLASLNFSPERCFDPLLKILINESD